MNRQSPSSSVQRARSTLAGHSAVPRGTNVTRMNTNCAMGDIDRQRTLVIRVGAITLASWVGKLSPGVSRPVGFPTFWGKVRIVSRALSGLFLVGVVNGTRKRTRTNRENARTNWGSPEKNRESSNQNTKGGTSKDQQSPH